MKIQPIRILERSVKSISAFVRKTVSGHERLFCCCETSIKRYSTALSEFKLRAPFLSGLSSTRFLHLQVDITQVDLQEVKANQLVLEQRQAGLMSPPGLEAKSPRVGAKSPRDVPGVHSYNRCLEY